MKVVYILSLGHSGSTLVDCMLGTHPDFFSSGELRFLNWQLERTLTEAPSVQAQNICTCEKDWRSCKFWSTVFARIKQETGKDILQNPRSFDTSYFGQYAYQDAGKFSRKLNDRLLGYFFRIWLEHGRRLSSISFLKRGLLSQIKNNWLLYELMSEVSGRQFIVDSSKHLLIALLLQQFRPKDVYLLFLHRDIRKFASSQKKRDLSQGKTFSLQNCILQHQIFNKRVSAYKKNIKNLQFLEGYYDNIVESPADFLELVVKSVGARIDYGRQLNTSFWIDPTSYHMVAGNPMRYRRQQLVRKDESWKDYLSPQEVSLLNEVHQLELRD